MSARAEVRLAALDAEAAAIRAAAAAEVDTERLVRLAAARERRSVAELAYIAGVRELVRLGDELLHALYHECGHLASGHVARGVPTRGRPVAGSVLDVLLRSREVEQEREAEAWCEARLARVSDSERWLTRILSKA